MPVAQLLANQALLLGHAACTQSAFDVDSLRNSSMNTLLLFLTRPPIESLSRPDKQLLLTLPVYRMAIDTEAALQRVSMANPSQLQEA